MNPPTFPVQQPLTPLAPMHPVAVGSAAVGDDRLSLARQLGVIAGMLSNLDTLTTAGQHHIMSKVVTFLADQAVRGSRRLSNGNQRAFADLLGHLARESEHLLPDVAAFRHRAEGVLALLAAIAYRAELGSERAIAETMCKAHVQNGGAK